LRPINGLYSQETISFAERGGFLPSFRPRFIPGMRDDNIAPLQYSAGQGKRGIMAGHSKWANIKHKKAAQDAKRGKIFTRLIKEITVAARIGGGDSASNPRLRLAVDKAYEQNMPKDNVERAIKRGSGDLEGVNYEEIRYEGYGTGGAAVLVDCMTYNRVRTVADVRHAFTKYNGNLGTDGSVAFLFKHCGQLLFAPGTDENKLMEAALEAGAEDIVSNDDGSIEVITAPYEFVVIRTALEKAGFKAELAEVTMKPANDVVLTGDESAKMQKLLDALENIDDVQEVYTTAVIAE
jgi:YebC/PmpR family DNA-binding regulatory protein